MKSFAALVGLVAVAQAQYYNGTTVWTTKTVQTLTTFCPEATTIVTGGNTYTATASETLTITDCPCTISHPVYTPYPPKPTHSEPDVYITTTVSEYTTYCPYPTTIPVGLNSTITVTEATTLTISECPCTLTKPGVVTSTISYVTTYCPEPTTLTIPVASGSSTTYPVTTPGTVTIPIEQPVTVPAPEPTYPATTGPAPPTTTPIQIPGTGSPVQPTTTGPIEANNAIKRDASFGAMVAAGLAAMFL